MLASCKPKIFSAAGGSGSAGAAVEDSAGDGAVDDESTVGSTDVLTLGFPDSAVERSVVEDSAGGSDGAADGAADGSASGAAIGRASRPHIRGHIGLFRFWLPVI
jgi:hypothetical protein